MNEHQGIRDRAVLVTIGRSLYVASVFVLNIGLARAMGPESFGSFQQVFIFNALFLILSLGIPETVYFFVPRLEGDEKTRFLGQTMALLLVSGMVTAGIFTLCAPLFAWSQRNHAIIPHLRLFGIYGCFYIASSFADPLFITFRRTSYVFLLNLLHGVFLVGLTAWYYLAPVQTIMLFKAMAVFGAFRYGLSMLLAMSIRSETGPVSIFRGSNNLMKQLVFALPIVLTSTVDIISRWLDKFVVSAVFGPETLGVFFVGAIEIPFVAVMVSSVYSVISPLLNSYHHSGDSEKFIRLVNTTFKILARLIWPLFVYCFVFADLLITVVFKETFAGAVLPFRIYLLLLPLRVASYGVILIALGKPQSVFRTAVLALLINLVLNILLALTVGYWGPAAATVIATYIHVLLLVVIILRQTNVKVSELIPFPQLFAVGVTSLFAVMIAFALSLTVHNDIARIAVSLVSFIIAYALLAVRAGFLNPGDLLIFRGGVKRG